MAAIGGGSKYLTEFKETDKDVLVKIVKLSQGRKTKGRKGDWKLASTGREEILTMIPPSTLWMCLPPLCRRLLNPKTLMRSNCDGRKSGRRIRSILRIAGYWMNKALHLPGFG
jgi:hypothetical protein